MLFHQNCLQADKEPAAKGKAAAAKKPSTSAAAAKEDKAKPAANGKRPAANGSMPAASEQPKRQKLQLAPEFAALKASSSLGTHVPIPLRACACHSRLALSWSRSHAGASTRFVAIKQQRAAGQQHSLLAHVSSTPSSRSPICAAGIAAHGSQMCMPTRSRDDDSAGWCIVRIWGSFHGAAGLWRWRGCGDAFPQNRNS